MEQNWKITVWGVRGSMPTPSQDFLQYGGNTSCISVDCGSVLVVFDAGSGLVQLGKRLKNSGIKRVDLFSATYILTMLLACSASTPSTIQRWKSASTAKRGRA